MSDFLNNGIVKVVFATLVAVAVLGLFGWLKFKRDEKIVIEFLKNSGLGTRHDDTTTTAIASATRLSETRIRRICGRSALIRRHTQDIESWKLHWIDKVKKEK